MFLPYQLNTLGQSAFKGCSSLQEIICAGLPLGVDDFDTEVYNQAKLYVPMGLTSEYQKTMGWNGFKNVEEYGLFMPDGSALRGQSRVVSVNVAKGLPISSFQMELDMPEGVVLVEGEDGGKEVWLSEENAQTHQLHFEKKDNGKYLVAVRDDQNRELQGEDAVLYLNMQLTPDAPTGTNIITLKDVNFTFNSPVVAAGEAEQIAMQRDMQTNLNVQVFKGDVNVNGRLNVADFVEDALYLKGSQTESFHFDEADVSNNGKVTIEDVNRMLNLIQEEQDLVVKTYFWDTDESSAESLSMKESWVVTGGVGRIKLTVPNALKTQHIPAYQFDIVLPPSVSLMGVENAEAVVSEIDTDENGNKVYRVVVASVEVENLLNADLLPSLIIESAAGTGTGALSVSLQHVVLADANAKEYLLDNISFDLLVNEGSDIANVYSEDGLFSHPQDIYNVNGQLMRKAAVSLDGLPVGIYIVGGQKKAASTGKCRGLCSNCCSNDFSFSLIIWIVLYTSLRPVTAVKIAVADSLGDVHGLYFLAAGKVGDGAGHFEDAAVGAGTQFQTLHRHAEHVQTGFIGFGIRVDHLFGHLGIAVNTFVILETLLLNLPGGNDTLADDRRGLTGLHLRKLDERNGLNFAVDVDAVE